VNAKETLDSILLHLFDNSSQVMSHSTSARPGQAVPSVALAGRLAVAASGCCGAKKNDYN
jgi:hypothetical protein